MDRKTKESSEDRDPEKTSLVDLQVIPKIQPAAVAGGSEKTNSPGNNGAVSHEDKKQGRGSALKQVLAALVAQLGTINTGLVFGFSAIALPQLKAADSFIKITSDDASWIASVNAIGTPLGCLFSGYMADALGRKMTLIITEIPGLLGWMLIAFATDIRMILAGRFFVGLSSGMVGAPARVYAAEVTQPHLRGMLVAFASVGVSTGVFLVYLIGKWLQWNHVAGICGLVPLASIILIFLFPETPSYLMSREKPEKARRALNRLRGSTCDLEKEMDTLVNFSKKNNTKKLSNPREIITAVLKPNAIKPFIMLFLYFGLYQWSGTNALTFNAVQIFTESGVKMDSNDLTIILGAVRVIATVAACILCRRCGRRPLTFFSSIGCGLSMLGLGVYKLATIDIPVAELSPSHSWFPASCVFTYTIFCTIGFLVIPWVMIGEVYPLQVRGFVGGLTTMSAHIFVFSVVKTYDHLKIVMGDGGIYTLYGVVPLVGTIYLYFFLVETKGKTLQDIEDYYSGRSNSMSPNKTRAQVNKPIVLETRKGQLLP